MLNVDKRGKQLFFIFPMNIIFDGDKSWKLAKSALSIIEGFWKLNLLPWISNGKNWSRAFKFRKPYLRTPDTLTSYSSRFKLQRVWINHTFTSINNNFIVSLSPYTLTSDFWELRFNFSQLLLSIESKVNCSYRFFKFSKILSAQNESIRHILSNTFATNKIPTQSNLSLSQSALYMI